MTEPETVAVWDPYVRIAHWILVIAFFTAYLTEGDPEVVHVWAGYTVAAYVVTRVIWGFVGPQRARFSDITLSPAKVFGYLGGLAKRTATRHIGHSPAGGAMVIALLLSLGATTLFGMAHLAEEEGEGPLSPWIEKTAEEAAHLLYIVTPAHAHEEGEEEHGEESLFMELHETFANISLFLVILHILGVAIASHVHKENLPRAMVTGRKRTGP